MGEKEAISIANDSSFGLERLYLHQRHRAGKRVANRDESSMVFTQKLTRRCKHSGSAPSAGSRGSGYGKELSDLGIREFVNKELICASNGMSLVA